MKLVPEQPIPSRSGSIPPYGDERGLMIRPIPPMPSDEELRGIFDLAEQSSAVEDGTFGLRAIWRHGCDTGMVAPLSDDAGRP